MVMSLSLSSACGADRFLISLHCDRRLHTSCQTLLVPSYVQYAASDSVNVSFRYSVF